MDMDTTMNDTQAGMMMNDTQAGMMMKMVPFLHFTGGDHLLFEAWQPTSGGTIGGACIGLFFFSIFERWVNAASPALMRYLARRKCRSYTKPLKDGNPSPQVGSKSSEMSMEEGLLTHRTMPPFAASVDIPRGLIYAFRRILGCTLMLTFMTFNVGYILSIIVGLALGETLFGRVRYGVVRNDQ